jgi:hypothetical protein
MIHTRYHLCSQTQRYEYFRGSNFDHNHGILHYRSNHFSILKFSSQYRHIFRGLCHEPPQSPSKRTYAIFFYNDNFWTRSDFCHRRLRYGQLQECVSVQVGFRTHCNFVHSDQHGK